MSIPSSTGCWSGVSSDSPHRVEIFDRRAAGGGAAHAGGGGLEGVGLAVDVDRGLVLVELEHLVAVRLGPALDQLVDDVAGLVGLDRLHHRAERGLELLALAG